MTRQSAVARIGLKGELTKHFAWEVEREIDANDDNPEHIRLELDEWKDAYGRWKSYDWRLNIVF